MSTPMLKVITEYCAIYVDDIRMQELAQTDAPLYARKMWQYLRASLPLFTLPEGMQEYLMGTETTSKMTEPQIADRVHTVAEGEGEIIVLGEEYAGFELCACRVRTEDDLGNVVLVPLQIEYDAENGTVKVNGSVDVGKTLCFDFYTDGYFEETLSPQIMMILGMCFNVVWQTRFMNDWLSNVDKIEDRSFSQQNRANKIRADHERYMILRRELAGEMRKLEQSIYFKEAFPLGGAKIK